MFVVAHKNSVMVLCFDQVLWYSCLLLLVKYVMVLCVLTLFCDITVWCCSQSV